MLNHLRTLLLNRDGNEVGVDAYPGEELVPDDYRALSLPSYLLDVRRRLFGSDPDRVFLNYRLHQYLTLLHATDLEEFVLGLDPRITYSDNRNYSLGLNETFSPHVTQLEGVVSELQLGGQAASPDFNGRCSYDFRIEILAPDSLEIVRRSRLAASWIEPLTLNSGLSPIFVLPDTGYTFRITTQNAGVAWRVRGYLRPQWDLSRIVADLDNMGEPTLLRLFGLDDEEPWSTFRNLWRRHDELPYRLGGLLLAVGYRTEAFRQTVGVV